MSTTFRPYAPDQMLLLPADLRAWLPESHLAHHVSDLMDGVDLTAFYAPYAGDGRHPLRPANKKKDPRYTGIYRGYTGIYRDMPGYSGMRPRRLRPMIVGVPPRVGAAYAGIGRRHCGSRLLIHQMAFKPRFPGVWGSLK